MEEEMKYVHEDYGEEYGEKRHKRKLWNLFVLKNYFYQELGVESRHFGKLVKRCSDYKYGRIKHLTDVEKKALEYLEKTNCNPHTLYKSYLSSRLPEDLKNKIGKPLRQSEALRLSRNRSFNQEIAISHELMNQVRKIVQEVL